MALVRLEPDWCKHQGWPGVGLAKPRTVCLKEFQRESAGVGAAKTSVFQSLVQVLNKKHKPCSQRKTNP